jgi:hypothetical protein
VYDECMYDIFIYLCSVSVNVMTYICCHVEVMMHYME